MVVNFLYNKRFQANCRSIFDLTIDIFIVVFFAILQLGYAADLREMLDLTHYHLDDFEIPGRSSLRIWHSPQLTPQLGSKHRKVPNMRCNPQFQVAEKRQQ